MQLPASAREREAPLLHRIKIGDPNQTITGEHTYTLTYLVHGSLNAFTDHDELYWNAVGNQWPVPIDQATVQVSAPVDVTRAACFAGPLGSTARCQHSGITSGVACFGQDGLGPNEGLTVVVAVPKSLIENWLAAGRDASGSSGRSAACR
jgi:Predicted membrane protein (DUF2207)